MKMKKIVALLLSGVMMTSLILCGCTPKETGNQEEPDQSGSQVETSIEPSEKTVPKLNEDNIKKAQEYCLSVDPEGYEGVPVLLNGIRGSGSTIVNDSLVFFSYSSLDGDTFGINVHRDSGEVSLSVYSMYVDTGYSVNVGFSLGEFEETFDKICDDPASVDPYSTSALDSHTEDIKKDFAIIFARMTALSDAALSDVGLGLKDLGIDLGDKYRAIDPTQLTSKEVEVTNEHKFENGFCTDCGMAWTEYYYEVVGKFMTYDLGTGQHTTSGQESASMLSLSDQVQYTADTETFGSMYYHHSDIDNDAGIKKDIWCYVDMSSYKKTMAIEVYFNHDQQKFSTGGPSYQYTLEFKTEAGEVDKVFESKEILEKSVKVTLKIDDDQNDSYIDDAWGTMKEEDIRKMMEADGLTYCTKEDIINMFWDTRVNIFESLDNGMVWMKTSLKDFGFNWK